MNTKTIQELRKEGFKVRVRHHRYHSLTGELWPTRKFHEQRLGNLMATNGGLTELSLLSPDGRVVEQVSDCCKLDPFNRKMALQIAVGRALKALNKGNFIEKKDETRNVVLNYALRSLKERYGNKPWFVDAIIDSDETLLITVKFLPVEMHGKWKGFPLRWKMETESES